MINLTLQLLRIAPKKQSEIIDFAKGKYLLPSNFKELKEYIKWQ